MGHVKWLVPFLIPSNLTIIVMNHHLLSANENHGLFEFLNEWMISKPTDMV